LGEKATGGVTCHGNQATGKPRTRLVMNASDTSKIQRYLRQRFGNHKLSIARRETKDDSADLLLEDEFIGVVFQDDEDGETCYHVQISILEEDLEEL
jgi:Na+-transporting NADH:ubiquinone oxidoreductase subunit NqrA